MIGVDVPLRSEHATRPQLGYPTRDKARFQQLGHAPQVPSPLPKHILRRPSPCSTPLLTADLISHADSKATS